ncbi:sensor histidine kinase [Actinomadura scrupuli]|uniref:sensor histidine kinase n=1 Tax=Actinomadura scrupuli TaxID=559629 RepID=UPI003D95ED9E
MRARTTMVIGGITALVCLGFSALFLIYVHDVEDGRAIARSTTAWGGVVPLIKQGRLPPVLPSGKGEAIQVLNARGRVVAATPRMLGKPPMAGFRPPGGQVQALRTLCPPAGLEGCWAVRSAKSYQSDGIWLIYAATTTPPWYGALPALLMAIIASVLVTALAAAGNFRVATRNMAPVNAIRSELAEITASGLHRRVPVPGHQREYALLAETVNATLDRLEGAYQQLQQFTSDASHDLRTPLTAVRTQVEEGLMYPEDTDWPRTAATILTGVERLQAIVADLLTLARLDSRPSPVRERTDLTALVAAELDQRPFTLKIVKDLQESVSTEGDRLQITRLLANLLDNAERHATSQVTVIVRAEGSTAVLEVTDDGDGIAPELREVVFERFTRLEASRARDAGGTGLGLAIARQTAEAHEGTLTIEDSERGARFVLRLPRYRPPAVISEG